MEAKESEGGERGGGIECEGGESAGRWVGKVCECE